MGKKQAVLLEIVGESNQSQSTSAQAKTDNVMNGKCEDGHHVKEEELNTIDSIDSIDSIEDKFGVIDEDTNTVEKFSNIVHLPEDIEVYDQNKIGEDSGLLTEDVAVVRVRPKLV